MYGLETTVVAAPTGAIQIWNFMDFLGEPIHADLAKTLIAHFKNRPTSALSVGFVALVPTKFNGRRWIKDRCWKTSGIDAISRLAEEIVCGDVKWVESIDLGDKGFLYYGGGTSGNDL